jgi:hypothetical protein
LERSNDMLEQVDDLYDKLQGTKNGGRRGRGRSEEAISPIEMLQSLQQLVDEHGSMEQESLAKDEELSRLRQQLAEARERQVRQSQTQCARLHDAVLFLTVSLFLGCACRGEASVPAAAESVRYFLLPLQDSLFPRLTHRV